MRKDGRETTTFYNKKLKKKKDVPLEFRARLRMRDKMETDDARRIYAMRKITVEPVIGQIKENLGFRKFCLRGLEGARIEINIVAIVHNLKKAWKGVKERKEIIENLNENCDKNLVLEIYIEINLIVRQRLLLGVPSVSESLQGVAKIRRIFELQDGTFLIF